MPHPEPRTLNPEPYVPHGDRTLQKAVRYGARAGSLLVPGMSAPQYQGAFRFRVLFCRAA